ncbi:hypothetical protein MKZ08_08395 [Viridibacillus sp. FSL R5-0477]|uniref:Uncharacterized protein n=1 Tax=Viridibacillus arenosi FSL R5-213 TaxID=1227360 RepID=W4EVB0_9BACL|nr:hypothetical protein [Viridibacillus arenosi]ETT84189.1 hypothetical protein C176_12513 [Viridibacillus arenosi FSL R5-213]
MNSYLKFLNDCIQECECNIQEAEERLTKGVVPFAEIKDTKEFLEEWREELNDLKQRREYETESNLTLY